MSERYTLKLTANQMDAIYSAINVFRSSYDGFPEEEMKDWGINPIMNSLRQVEAKMDKSEPKGK